MTSRFLSWIVDKDIFGQPVGVNYEGSDSFKTKVGALITVLTYLVMLMNLSTLLTAFADGSRQEENQATSVIDKFITGPHNLQENQFEVAIIRFWSLPQNIGRLVAY